MAVSPFTLQNLYNQGILDYVPAELAGGVNVSNLSGMQNPYLDMATQGRLYQNAMRGQDSFSYTGNGSSLGGNNKEIIGDLKAGINASGINPEYPIGASDAGINGFGGGFGKIGEGVSTAISSTSGLWKGLASGLVLLGTIRYCIKKCKKPKQKTTSNFMSKLQFWKKK